MKTTKKLISLLLSLLMVVSALPMTAITANAATDESINIGLTGSYVGITAADANRYSASGQTATLNIVNDQEDSNFSIGYVNIDISAYSGREFKTFPLTFGKGADADTESQGVKFWYIGNTNGDSLTTNGRVANNSNVTGTENGHLAKAISYYALTEIASFTKAQFNAGTMNIDVAAAANATMARGGTRLVIMITQPNSGQKSSTGGWTDTKVTFNKSQACSATLKGQTTKTGKLSNNGTGLAISGSESRWSSNQFNIVNDQQANNTDAGIIKYNISGITGMSVESAKLNYKIDSWSADTVTTGLTFYYSTSINNESTYINNSETKSTGWTCGSGTTANNSFATGLGFSTSNTLGVVSKGSATSTTQMDIKSALQKALDAGATKFFIIIMQSTAGGSGSNSGWSDTKLAPANFTIDYTVKEKTRTRTDVANAKNGITSTEIANAPYSGNADRAADSSYTSSNLGGNDKMSSVLWSYGVGNNSAYDQASDSSYYLFGVQYGDVTLLYNGVDELAFPVNGYFMRKGASSTFYPQSMYLTSDYDTSYANSNNVLELKKIWHAGSGSNGGAGYKKDSTYGVNYYDTTDYADPKSMAMNENDKAFYYSNTMYIKPSALTFGDNKRATITKIRIGAKIHDEKPGAFQSANKSRTYDLTPGSIRVINYKPIYDAIVKGKEIYNTVKDDENSYCPADLYNFYEAFDKLISFNPRNYFNTTSTDGNSNGYAACCDAIAALDPYITPAQSPLTKSNTSYTHSYTNGEAKNAQKHKIHCNDCGEDIEEACTFTLTSTVDATCTATGTKTYTCSKCSGTVTETVEKKEHNWGAWSGEYSSTKHTRQCQDCKAWDEYYDHDSNTIIPGTPATCTEAGLEDGAKCSKCGRIMVAQEKITALGHTEADAVEENRVEATCTTDGSYDTVVYCSVCNEELSRETTTLTATGHHYENWTPNGDGKHTGTCKDCTETTTVACSGGTATCTEQATCEVCGGKYGDPKGHSYTSVVTDPTCTEQGYTTYTCTSCNDSYTGNYVDATGHTQVKDNRVTPTCTKPGLTEGLHCSVCGTIIVAQQEVSALGHRWNTGVVTTPATCTTTGEKTYTCSVCNDTKTETIDIDESAHDYQQQVSNEGDVYTWTNVCSRDANHVGETRDVDISAYKASVELAQAEIDNASKYTQDSINELKKYIIKLDLTATSTLTQDDVDDYNDALTTANNLVENGGVLEYKENTLTFNVIKSDDGDTLYKQTYKLRYGEQQALDVKVAAAKLPENYSVQKWTRYEKGETLKLNTANEKLTIVMPSKDIIYNVYVNDIGGSQNDSYQVKMMTNYGKVADIAYVAKGEQSVAIDGNEITFNGTTTLTAQDYPFYQVYGYIINGVSYDQEVTLNGYNVQGDITIEPIYTVTRTCKITLGSGITTNDEVENAKWNSLVTLTADGATENTQWYMTDANGNEQLAGYGKTFKFRVSHNCTVSIKNAEAKANVFVEHLSYNTPRKKSITAVAKYVLPAGCTLVDTGVIMKTSESDTVSTTISEYENATKGRFSAENKLSDTKQFVIHVYASKEYKKITVGAVAYLKYTDSNGEQHTIYSDGVTTHTYTKPQQ